MRRSGAAALGLVVAVLAGAAAAQGAGCLCCTERGLWEQRAHEPSAAEWFDLDQLRFAVDARLRPGPLGVIRRRVASAPLAESWRVSVVRGRKQWTIQMEDAAGRLGALVLYLPKSWTDFRTDPGDGRALREGEPLLYKELRLEGAVAAEGLFEPDVTPASRFRLILQGRGNGCFAGADFASWILQLEGPDPGRPTTPVVYYALHGRLDAPGP